MLFDEDESQPEPIEKFRGYENKAIEHRLPVPDQREVPRRGVPLTAWIIDGTRVETWDEFQRRTGHKQSTSYGIVVSELPDGVKLVYAVSKPEPDDW